MGKKINSRTMCVTATDHVLLRVKRSTNLFGQAQTKIVESTSTSCKIRNFLLRTIRQYAQNCVDKTSRRWQKKKFAQRRFNECMKPLLTNTSIQIDVKATRLIAAMSKIAGLWGGFNEPSVD